MVNIAEIGTVGEDKIFKITGKENSYEFIVFKSGRYYFAMPCFGDYSYHPYIKARTLNKLKLGLIEEYMYRESKLFDAKEAFEIESSYDVKIDSILDSSKEKRNELEKLYKEINSLAEKYTCVDENVFKSNAIISILCRIGVLLEHSYDNRYKKLVNLSEV